ncbi:Gfo/Idh/MocA family protein [Candidatus Binatus sp.]|uniref:Gfo/Idh/MocA family protein n=1 Tax=Candidatus Binatus sp. TaxID=2811406 RepID=UPI003BB052DE
MNDFIMINEKNPPMENGYRNGVSKNGHANGTPKVESVNGANAKSTIQLERPLAVVNPRPAAAAKEQRAQLRGIGVVGLGYWGPNWVRNLHQSQAARRIVACDLDQKRRLHVSQLYSDLETTSHFEDLLNDDDIEGIVVATPVGTHYGMAKRALEAGKSVLVEKPMATSNEDANDLVKTAREKNLILMVGHTFEYSAPVLKMHDIIASGELGDVFYISSVRANLGLFQRDVNVTWDLATHDISIILNLMNGHEPEAVSCQGESHYGSGVEDVAMLTLRFERNVIAFIHVSWLDPDKIRRTTVVGSRKMLVYDDTAPQEKIRIYDKGVTAQKYYDTFGEFQFSYRYGDIQIPRIEEKEPLFCECEHFVNCIKSGQTPNTDGVNGARVVSVLEAANYSLRRGGLMVPLGAAVR